jgi:hypothetical protein
MNIVSWNIRGLNGRSKHTFLINGREYIYITFVGNRMCICGSMQQKLLIIYLPLNGPHQIVIGPLVLIKKGRSSMYRDHPHPWRRPQNYPLPCGKEGRYL